ncbi:MAG: type II toxin-antitoxin system VapC family toxin [Nocardioides sp.]
MRLLLDTHVVLWELNGSRTLSRVAEEALDRATELLFSTVSFAEIGIKASVGKLTVPPGLARRVQGLGVRILPLESTHGLAVAELPLHHRDPFDRLLVAQAQCEQLTIVTSDPRLAAYDVGVIPT